MNARTPLHSILVATDLKDGSSPVLRSAGLLADRMGVELHVLHVLEPERRFSMAGGDRVDEETRRIQAGDLLEDQVRQNVPSNVVVKSMKVEHLPAVHSAILRRAEEVEAGLIVLGPQSGGSARSHFLGTTADRVLVMTGIPCLVVEDVIADPVERIGVPVDFSTPSGVALLAALSIGTKLSDDGEDSAAAPELQVMHVGWTIERADNPDLEERELRPRLKQQVDRALYRHPEAQHLRVDTEVLWGNDPASEIAGWVRRDDIDLLVMGTHGRTGFRRAILGSVATRIARRMPCPMLLVPPSYGGGWTREPALDRVLITTDFHDTDVETARWCVRTLAPDARHLLVHVVDEPETPVDFPTGADRTNELLESSTESVRSRLDEMKTMLGEAASPGSSGAVDVMAGEGRPEDEITRMAAEADVDLIVMGGYRHVERQRTAFTSLSSTVERVLRAAPAPVLLVRGRPEQPPGCILVAIDGSEPSLRALAWADLFRRRFDASCTAFFVESPALFDDSDTVSQSMDVSDTSDSMSRGSDDDRTAGWARATARFMRQSIRRAGADSDGFSLRAAIGRPAEEILVEQERSGADLIVLGTHGRGAGMQAVFGSVAGAIIREAPCSVMAVGNPATARE